MVRVAVIRFPGSNCDEDTRRGAERAGCQAYFVWHRDASLQGADAVVLPGGFSYGDYLRSGAIARFSPIMKAVQAHAAAGGTVIGICNGFQILCEAHLLPGALMRNAGLTFVSKPVVTYGWHQLNGSPIQPLYNGHGETYADYSHGIRLVQNAAELDGAPTTVGAVLTDNALSVLLSDEGVIARPRYGDAPAGIGITPDTAGQGSMFEGAFPNPFNTSTEVRYRLASDDAVTLKVYDLLGRETATLVDAAMDAGAHEVTFDGSGHASGVYIVRFMAGRSVQSGKIVLLR
jgi:imidazoleglycerol phosphate synthase glutamine amidotransferase subunit HisH